MRSRLVSTALLLALFLLGVAPAIDASSEPVTVGFGKRAITPVGEPPAEWARYFTPHPVTKVWGEPYQDLNGDGCMSGLTNGDLEPVTKGQPPRAAPEPHVDQPWNSAGDAYMTGSPLYTVRGVTIIGDPQSSGKWDGVWGNAGFGSRCAKGAKDDTWARVALLEQGQTAVALVSLDVVGLFNLEIQRAQKELAVRYPHLAHVKLVVSSTHTHEGVDTMGFWGQLIAAYDGKFPAYQAFLRSQMLDAVHDAWASREEATVKFAKTELTTGIRDSRDPKVIDPWLYAAQFIRADGSTIGTITNWSNHPEAQGSKNHLISSDFPHGTRETLEARLGGIAVYFSGSVGGLMTPLGVDIPGFGSAPSWERTYELGRLVAVAAEKALASAPAVAVDDLEVAARRFYVDSDNNALRALNVDGIFDIPTYTGGDSWGTGEDTEGIYSARFGSQVQTEMVAVRFGPALFLTVPGELSPELELGGYGRSGCTAMHTGRPYEPVIAEQFEETYQFVLGLGQDELGYIIPGYDFWIYSVGQEKDGRGVVPVGLQEVDDACNGDGHYEETVSISSVFAPWVTCTAAELAGRNPWATEAACSRENTSMNPYGVRPPAPPNG